MKEENSDGTHRLMTLQNPPTSSFHGNIKFQRMMNMTNPLPAVIQGQNQITLNRKVVWKNVCVIGEDERECLLEMSKTKLKFYIIALDMAIVKYHCIDLWQVQADKILSAAGNF